MTRFHFKFWRNRITGLLFLAPVLALILFVSYIPFVWNLVLSFQEWGGFRSPSWVGLDNYIRIFNDATALKSFYNSAYLGFAITLISVAMGIILAACIYPLGNREGALFRFALFTPVMIPTSIIAILFTFIYSPVGVINQALRTIGLESWTRIWLGDPGIILPSLVMVEVYHTMGITMMLCYTAMLLIPKSLFEAGKLEGISYLRQFTLIILPLIRPIIQLCVVLTLIKAFRTFDTVRIMTNGGPGNHSKTVPLYMTDTAFSFYEFGYSAAMGALFTVLLLSSILIAKKLLGGESYEY